MYDVIEKELFAPTLNRIPVTSPYVSVFYACCPTTSGWTNCCNLPEKKTGKQRWNSEKNEADDLCTARVTSMIYITMHKRKAPTTMLSAAKHPNHNKIRVTKHKRKNSRSFLRQHLSKLRFIRKSFRSCVIYNSLSITQQVMGVVWPNLMVPLKSITMLNDSSLL